MQTIRLDEKRVIILNGRGGSGKDSFITFVGTLIPTVNIDSVGIPKDIAEMYTGYYRGKTDDRTRKFLHDLKQVLVDYTNAPVVNTVRLITEFLLENNNDIAFIHIREPQQIDAVKKICQLMRCKVDTVLFRREDKEVHNYGNEGDDNVEDYDYDIEFVIPYTIDTKLREQYYIKMLEEIIGVSIQIIQEENNNDDQ